MKLATSCASCKDPTLLLSQSEEESKSWLKYNDTLSCLGHSGNLKKELNFLFTQQRTKTPDKRTVLFSKLNLVALQFKDTISSTEIFKQSTKLPHATWHHEPQLWDNFYHCLIFVNLSRQMLTNLWGGCGTTWAKIVMLTGIG